MEISYGKQITIEAIADKTIDIFVCAENHEKRSFTLLESLSKSSTILRSIVLCYNDSICADKRNGTEKIKIENHNSIYTLLDIELAKISKDDITIFVDYSCMTKSWYYSVILYLKNKNNSKKNIIVYFSYTPSQFVEPKDPKPNKEIGPLPGKYVVPTDKPKALIVCLGYEQNKAEGIIEHLDPKISYLFYTDPAADIKFVKTLKKHNTTILTERSDYLIAYPFDNLLYLEKELMSLYYKLREEYSIIIAPLGPKPYTFVAMLMSAKYQDIDIWRVGSGYDINEYENPPINNKSFIICEVLFQDSGNC